eukprot:CAMPEP_0115498270 /NCGR_PEP_ID=MMETSP0271-20121206/66712_1 /TAXON_ID=71861 /ORGANISM="Scrippsiella trochoidea, Strain CCMP3099" /LENGTH=126 /DNA_ID=CAMNT_0002927001 /DNA_START=255 /DNA_END=636 /DNA_ORIENTATION=+
MKLGSNFLGPPSFSTLWQFRPLVRPSYTFSGFFSSSLFSGFFFLSLRPKNFDKCMKIRGHDDNLVLLAFSPSFPPSSPTSVPSALAELVVLSGRGPSSDGMGCNQSNMPSLVKPPRRNVSLSKRLR